MLNSMLTEERGITEPAVIEAVSCTRSPILAVPSFPLSRAVRQVSQKVSLSVGSGDEAQPGSLPGSLPTLHDFMFDFDQRRWRPWSTEVPPYEPPPDRKFSSIVVPTSDTVRSTWLLDSVVSVKGACLMVGESGTAKTTVIASYLLSRTPDKISSLGINFSSRTASIDVQTALEASIEKRTKDVFGPPAGKRLLVFVDDLNMPKVDTYGTQQPIALLKLLIDKGFMYDRGKDLTIKYIKDMQFISAMVPVATRSIRASCVSSTPFVSLSRQSRRFC